MLWSSWLAWHYPYVLHCPYAFLLMVDMTLSICVWSSLLMFLSPWLTWHCLYGWHHFSLRFSPHGLHGIVHMWLIIPPYAVVLMVRMTLSIWFILFVLMLFSSSSWFAWHCPYVSDRPSVCCCPYGWHDNVHMFAWHCPYVSDHRSLCFSPHGWHDIVHMVDIISPYAVLLMVCMALSICGWSSLPMLLSLWLSWYCPYGWHHPSLCCSPHGWHDIVHTFLIIPPYVYLLMFGMTLSSRFKPVVLMLLSSRFRPMCPYVNYHISGARY